MDTHTKVEAIKTFAEEILTEQELVSLYETNNKPLAYDGFEPSGVPHIAQAVIRASTINQMTKTGVRFNILVADWHAMANNKFDGDLTKIQKVGEYLVEVWKASGMDLSKVKFIQANDFMSDTNYWNKVMQIARSSTVNRIIRCSQIMGRSENDSLQASQIFYPCMQAADIFHMKIDIAQLGMDQRKVNILARELGDKLFGYKPVAVHHHMLMGLSQPASTADAVERTIAIKMSKSNPDNAIIITDTTTDVERKLKKAYCPEGIIEDNPVMELFKYMIFPKFGKVQIKRDAKFGGDVEFESYEELVKAYMSKSVHPVDLKSTTAKYVNESLDPIRDHFSKNTKRKELQEQVLSWIQKK